MDRHALRSQLATLDLTRRTVEEPFRDQMIALLDAESQCFHRSCFPGHFTASAFIVSADGSRTLLNHHRKLNRWLHFGGHCDGDENLVRVAQREALEECGIEGLILASARPFDLDVHPIPAHGNEPDHFHYDVNFVLIAPEGATEIISPESVELRWFTPEEMQALPLVESMRRITRKWQDLRERRAHAAPDA
ncbi:ADP-ribose pyrophosphatase YjhB (NUDIX family) [Roseimicrobium gellanilyticum]|uniref:ADP-ribose pyrophosphatase YjhB (NUDIX family) n=1 Tax=Roseimicrobium gellanilyticum TaxID=748857 RepID=A0A366HTH4_9BACT|nr:NUDIX hydrolase [Roseimicrobium gellanilyticum]RBP47572.1 ADP-ribose pyrophosphatase YjhB (NUDIX family) [Roseimicrobium gellanilyticum]